MSQHPLAQFMTDESRIADLARRVGCSAAHLRNIRDGRKIPSLGLAKRISDATGMRMELFVRPPEAA